MQTKNLTTNLGGKRLGSGDKNNITLHAYKRSTHDLSRAWRSTMSPGVLVPCFLEVFTPGEDFPVNIDALVKTTPTIAPLYGDFKLQVDMFFIPFRLYNGLLHTNLVSIGTKMSDVIIPKIELSTKHYKSGSGVRIPTEEQIATDSLAHYLGISGICDTVFAPHERYKTVTRKFNAVPFLGYWDIVKNYYSNKQENKVYYIAPAMNEQQLTQLKAWDPINLVWIDINNIGNISPINGPWQYYEGDTATPINIPNNIGDWSNVNLQLRFDAEIPTHNIAIYIDKDGNGTDFVAVRLDTVLTETPEGTKKYLFNEVFTSWNNGEFVVECHELLISATAIGIQPGGKILGVLWDGIEANRNKIKINNADIENLNQAKIDIFRNTMLGNEFTINQLGYTPYSDLYGTDNSGVTNNYYSQNGLALKCYQSDLFNNWLKTEWIDGPNGVNELTRISTAGGSFTIDSLQLAKKIYNLYNRIIAKGNTGEDYYEAVYSIETQKRIETPLYIGGASYEIIFDEVISQSATEDQPLGSIAGKGTLVAKRGGEIEFTSDEPGFIMGIASITPRIDYSQGNKWFMTDLDNIEDIHQPELDGIGFEDLLHEYAAWWGAIDNGGVIQRPSFGKVPAWIKYMTAINETHGDFARLNNSMIMTLNRRYEADGNGNGINDPTAYINPTKFNYAFAGTELTSQNFKVQIAFECKPRIVISAKQIPIA